MSVFNMTQMDPFRWGQEAFFLGSLIKHNYRQLFTSQQSQTLTNNYTNQQTNQETQNGKLGNKISVEALKI